MGGGIEVKHPGKPTAGGGLTGEQQPALRHGEQGHADMLVARGPRHGEAFDGVAPVFCFVFVHGRRALHYGLLTHTITTGTESCSAEL
jgi:hypothetical protein